MIAHAWEEETMPLPRLSGSLLQHFLHTYQLNLRDVARASHLRLLIIWRACRGLPITGWQANRLRAGLHALTGLRYCSPILTHEEQTRLAATVRPTQQRGSFYV